jgi:serine/threonine protein kinase
VAAQPVANEPYNARDSKVPEAVVDRSRILKQIKTKGITSNGKTLKVLRSLGEGGNGAALLCKTEDGNDVVVKVYLPPDKRDLDERALARFENEVKLTSKISHPNVVRALDSGKLTLGTYSLPFYVMPRAARTLRDFTNSHNNEPSKIENRMRLFLRAAFGVSCLHSNGIVHRDLKPENVLIGKDGSPWVADLGIAHINPDFVSVGVKTIASERLLNRDYYAPEQRFGDATDVDSRADIYALGYILYELLTGAPPVRSSSPALSKTNESFAPLDPIFLRMTAHDKKDRYRALEDAVEDVSLAFGWVLATIKGARPAENADVPTMTRLLKSSNEAHRQRGILLASQLREEALPLLHELTGNARRDVRNAAVVALGEITSPSSLPFLVGCLYGGGNPKASTFRPAADSAAAAIGRYPLDLRLRAVADIIQPVRPMQFQQILKDAPKDAAYAVVQSAMGRGMVLLDWGETVLALLASIDEERAWPDVAKGISDGTLNSFRARELAPVLSVGHQTEFLTFWIDSLKDAWYFNYALKAILDSKGNAVDKLELLGRLKNKVELFSGRFDADKRRDLLADIKKAELRESSSLPYAL